jgi:hypothetical protein
MFVSDLQMFHKPRPFILSMNRVINVFLLFKIIPKPTHLTFKTQMELAKTGLVQFSEGYCIFAISLKNIQ